VTPLSGLAQSLRLSMSGDTGGFTKWRQADAEGSQCCKWLCDWRKRLLIQDQNGRAL